MDDLESRVRKLEDHQSAPGSTVAAGSDTCLGSRTRAHAAYREPSYFSASSPRRAR
jgi:hypothetical protein